jgi:hypothetical protein
MLDHVIALNEPHLRRLLRDYVTYYHHDRIHDSLAKDTQYKRPVEQRQSGGYAESLLSTDLRTFPCKFVRDSDDHGSVSQ